MTSNILQDAFDFAKVDLFGQLEDNVKYTCAIAKAIEEMGHIVELIFIDTVRLTSIVHPQIEGKFTATPGGLTNLFYGCKD